MQVSVPDKNVGYILSRGLLDKKSGALFRDNKKLAIILSTIEDGQNKGETVSEIINQIDRKLAPNSPSAKQKDKLDFISKLLRQCVDSQVGLTILTALCRDVAPLCNAAVEKIPSKEFLREARKIAEDDLKKYGDAAIETIISNWDDFTYTSCLTKENDIGRDLMVQLSADLEKYTNSISSEVIDHLISGSLQEFERRAGQKRKGRAGDDLQQSVEVIMNHLGVNLDPIPQHLTGILEADHVIKDNRHMCIVSCKRTGRERVKQVSVELQELQRHRIRKIIWFFTDFDQSENRIEDLGVRGSIFYLPDSSHDYKRFSTNRITSPYIFPISQIRLSLPKLLRGEI
jgi:hypothetical protein